MKFARFGGFDVGCKNHIVMNPYALLLCSLFVQMGTTLCIPCRGSLRLLLVHSLCHKFLLVLTFLSSVFIIFLLLNSLSCQMLAMQRFSSCWLFLSYRYLIQSQVSTTNIAGYKPSSASRHSDFKFYTFLIQK